MDEDLVRILSAALESGGASGSRPPIETKSVFGAVGAYVDGRIFGSKGAFGLALKLPEETRRRLMEDEGGTPLRYFPKGHVKREYAVLPEDIVSSPERLGPLVREAMAYALGGPASPGKR